MKKSKGIALENVDLVINGKPLTEKQKQAISYFIKADKERLAKRKIRLTKKKAHQR